MRKLYSFCMTVSFVADSLRVKEIDINGCDICC